MKIKNFKKYILNYKDYLISFKKYIIGFILGISLISTFAYAADTGSIGALFEKIDSVWYLKNIAVKDNTLSGSKILDNSITNNKISTGTISKSKLEQSLKDEIDNKLGEGENIIVGDVDVKGVISNSTIKNISNFYYESGGGKRTSTTNDYPLEINDSLLVNDIYTNNLKSKNGLIKIYGDNSVYGKINIYGDSSFHKNTYIYGDLSLYSKINGLNLEKKVKVDDNNWYTVINNTYKPKRLNNSAWTKQFRVPDGKVVVAIRLSGTSDDGGACAVQVYNKLTLAVTHKAYLTKLSLTEFLGGRARSDGAGEMSTQVFNISSLSGLKYLGDQDYSNNFGYNVASGVSYINEKEFIDMMQRYNDGQGAYYNTCKMEVKYGELYY